MDNILVIADPVDHQPTAIEKALELAKYNECEVHILIFCHAQLAPFAESVEGGEAALKSQILEDQHNKWKAVIARYQGESKLSYEILWEKDIVSFVMLHCKDKQYDLVVKTGHRSESLMHTPSDWQLLRESPAPVYLVSPHDYKSKKVILAAVDLLTEQSEKQQLNKQVLEAAFRLSIHTNSTLHVAFAIKIPAIIRELELIDISSKTRALEARARESAKALLTEYQIDEASLHINKGVPGEVIAQIANSLGAACTVVGTIGRTGLSGKLLGNSCETSLRYVKGDQLVVSS